MLHHGYFGNNKAVTEYSNTKSMLFDGTDEYLTVADHASLAITPNISVFAWVKCSAVDAVVNRMIAAQWAGTTNRGWYLNHYNGLLEVGFTPNGSTYNFKTGTTTGLNDGNWHCVGFTLAAGSTTLELYIDGANANGTTSGSSTSIYDSTTALTIGAFTNSSSTIDGFFPGNIDEVVIFDAALSSSEVTELYNSGVPFDLATHSAAANLVSYWRMGDGTGDSISSIKDQVGSNDATPVNMESEDIEVDAP